VTASPSANQVPNLFPYIGVAGQFIFLDCVAQQLVSGHGIFPAQIYLIVDYDVGGDSRFRVSHFPDVQRLGGSLALTNVVQRNSFQNPMWSIPKPPTTTINKWLSQLHALIKQDLSALRQIGIVEREPGSLHGNLDQVETLIWIAYERSSTLAEFNAFYLSQIVNVCWGLPTAFIPGHLLQPAMQTAYEFLLQMMPVVDELTREAIEFFRCHGIAINYKVNQSPRSFPVWITCEACFTRVPLYVRSNTPLLLVQGHCNKCGLDYNFHLGTSSTVDLTPICHLMSPRVLLDNLLDVVALGTSGATGYIGQTEHMLLTQYVARGLNWEMPPHSLWSPHSVHYGPAECRAVQVIANQPSRLLVGGVIDALRLCYFGRASTLYYIISRGLDGLLVMWRDYFQSGGQVQNLNDGRYGALLQISDRLLENLKNFTDPWIHN
jgi:hypothetical protein